MIKKILETITIYELHLFTPNAAVKERFTTCTVIIDGKIIRWRLRIRIYGKKIVSAWWEQVENWGGEAICQGKEQRISGNFLIKDIL